jgi:hypothetical protein
MVSIAKGGEKGDFRCAKYDKMSVRVIDCLGYGAGGFEGMEPGDLRRDQRLMGSMSFAELRGFLMSAFMSFCGERICVCWVSDDVASSD